jgi:hypothetical protein
MNLGDHVGDDAACVAANRSLLARALNAQPVFMRQVHGSTVVSLSRDAADNPLQADLVEVVPLKLIAFRGPRDLGGAKYVDNEQQCTRRFGPEHFADAFQDLGASDVVRLNAAEYDAADSAVLPAGNSRALARWTIPLPAGAVGEAGALRVAVGA